MNYSVFDRTIAKVYKPVEQCTQQIHQGLDSIQQRNKERQAQLKTDHDRQTAQINSLLGR